MLEVSSEIQFPLCRYKLGTKSMNPSTGTDSRDKAMQQTWSFAGLEDHDRVADGGGEIQEAVHGLGGRPNGRHRVLLLGRFRFHDTVTWTYGTPPVQKIARKCFYLMPVKCKMERWLMDDPLRFPFVSFVHAASVNEKRGRFYVLVSPSSWNSCRPCFVFIIHSILA